MTPDKGSLASVSPLSPYTSLVVSASIVLHEPVHAQVQVFFARHARPANFWPRGGYVVNLEVAE